MKNREILFRGKRVDNGEWVYGYYCEVEMFNHAGIEHFIIEYSCDGVQYIVIPETVGQFTGLYDSTKWEALSESEQKEWLENHTADEWKGRKIFEGDVLDLTHYLIMDVGVVKFGEYKDLDMGNDYPCGHVGFYVDVEKQRNSVRKDILFSAPKCKVIGNIHDNPELMKGE